jgi:23S rRNA G2069 N7-methylase RlmK/C1962 C5-methylase RlmI
LVNSEGDRLSGLIADVLGDSVVVQSVAAWAERYKAHVIEAIQGATGIQQVIWRPNVSILRAEGIEVGSPHACAG